MLILIVILLALLAEHFLSKKEGWWAWAWIDDYFAWMQARLQPTFLGEGLWYVISVLLLPLIVVGLIYVILLQFLFGLMAVVFSILILWYCFDMTRLKDEVDHYAAGTHDSAITQARTEWLLGEPLDANLSPNQAVTRSILWQYHERVFALMFWFCILGPLGPVLYCFTRALGKATSASESPYHSVDNSVRKLHGILAWVPARLTAMSYTLAGNFVPSFKQWVNQAWTLGNSKALLMITGEAALSFDASGSVEEPTIHKSAFGLANRALVVWLMVIALLTIAVVFF